MCYQVQKSLSQLEALVRNLEIQVLEHHTRPRESDTLRVGPSSLCLDKPSHPQNSDALICQLLLWHMVDRGGRREGGVMEELEGKLLT